MSCRAQFDFDAVDHRRVSKYEPYFGVEDIVDALIARGTFPSSSWVEIVPIRSLESASPRVRTIFTFINLI